MEDLTTGAAPAFEEAQKDDLRALGLDWDGPVVRQSERAALYDGAIDDLTARGLTYPCYCSRREIREATAAPHGPLPDAYPGTCRELSLADRRSRERDGRRPALRLRAERGRVAARDRRLGTISVEVDDFVLRRGDGLAAYNLAVVVDDGRQSVGEVVRGEDLWPTTPRQVLLCQLLGLPVPAYLHVPLVVNAAGERLAKRDGPVTLSERAARGQDPGAVLSILAGSLGVAGVGERVTPSGLISRFDAARLPAEPWVANLSD